MDTFDRIEKTLEPPFPRQEGFAFLLPIGITGDTLDISDTLSDLVLYEDDKPLGPARSAHGDIRALGRGRYSHWKRDLYFSTSDNSDPNTNGRTYRIAVTPRDPLYDGAAYGLKITRNYVAALRAVRARPAALPCEGLSVFELGPGPSMTSAMAIAAFGGKAFVKEREPLVWLADKHGEMAKRMLDILKDSGEPFDPDPLAYAIKAGAPDPAHIEILNEDKAVIAATLLKGKIDFTCSVAVLEHVEKLDEELAFLHAISKAGSVGLHWVDFRDHHAFNQPLEFLTLDDEAFLKTCEYRYSRGNRLRYPDFAATAQKTGFRVRLLESVKADAAYMESFMPRLKASGSAFSAYSREAVEIITAHVCLEKA